MTENFCPRTAAIVAGYSVKTAKSALPPRSASSASRPDEKVTTFTSSPWARHRLRSIATSICGMSVLGCTAKVTDLVWAEAANDSPVKVRAAKARRAKKPIMFAPNERGAD